MVSGRPSASPLVLAVDLGTSALKAGLVAADGSLVGAATSPLAPVRFGPAGEAEADATEWVPALREAVHRLGAQAAGSGLGGVGAVVVCGHGPSLVPVGQDGEPLRPAMLWLDRRASAEAEDLTGLWGRRIEPWYLLPKILWLSRHEPATYEGAAWFLSCPELLDYYLTGSSCTVLHTESFRHYYWSDEVVGSLGLDKGKLPPFAAPGEVLGKVRAAVCDGLGLPHGVPVVAGGADFLMSLLGTGVVVPGRVCDRAGSSEAINLCSPVELRDARLTCHPHPIHPFWNIAGMVSASGLVMSWLRGALRRAGESYEDLFEAIAAVPPGARGLLFLPSGGPGGARGSAGAAGPGGTGLLAGLDLRHGPDEIARAVVESVGFAIRDVLLAMREHGLLVEEMRVTGGQARLDRWNQIKADMAGVDVRVPLVADAELTGCAAVGFVALGSFGSLGGAAECMVRIGHTFAPDRSAHERYDELHARYRAALPCAALLQCAAGSVSGCPGGRGSSSSR